MMPFPQQTPRVFNRANVEAINPGQKGCYGLVRREVLCGLVKPDVWVYVGKGDIRERLLAHLSGDNPCITGQAATHYVTALTQNMDQMETDLIWGLMPVCNKKVG